MAGDDLMVTKKKTSTKSTTKKTTAVEAAVEKAEASDDAERQARLSALRERRKGQGAGTDGGDGSPGWQLDGESSERKREIVKKLMTKRKKRAAQGGAGNQRMAQGGARKKRLGQGAGRKKRLRQGGAGSEASGEGLAQYPRLKKLLAKRGGKKSDGAAAEIVELENRVARLETAVETLLQKLDDAKVLKS